MKLPNGYGTVKKLSGNRRNPYVVKKTVGWHYDEAKDKMIQEQVTLGYVATRKAGLQLLSSLWALFPQKTKSDGIEKVKELFIGQLYVYYGIIIGEETVAVIHFLIYLAVIVLQLVLIPAAPTELEDYYE